MSFCKAENNIVTKVPMNVCVKTLWVKCTFCSYQIYIKPSCIHYKPSYVQPSWLHFLERHYLGTKTTVSTQFWVQLRAKWALFKVDKRLMEMWETREEVTWGSLGEEGKWATGSSQSSSEPFLLYSVLISLSFLFHLYPSSLLILLSCCCCDVLSLACRMREKFGPDLSLFCQHHTEPWRSE